MERLFLECRRSQNGSIVILDEKIPYDTNHDLDLCYYSSHHLIQTIKLCVLEGIPMLYQLFNKMNQLLQLNDIDTLLGVFKTARYYLDESIPDFSSNSQIHVRFLTIEEQVGTVDQLDQVMSACSFWKVESLTIVLGKKVISDDNRRLLVESLINWLKSDDICISSLALNFCHTSYSFDTKLFAELYTIACSKLCEFKFTSLVKSTLFSVPLSLPSNSVLKSLSLNLFREKCATKTIFDMSEWEQNFCHVIQQGHLDQLHTFELKFECISLKLALLIFSTLPNLETIKLDMIQYLTKEEHALLLNATKELHFKVLYLSLLIQPTPARFLSFGKIINENKINQSLLDILYQKERCSFV